VSKIPDGFVELEVNHSEHWYARRMLWFWMEVILTAWHGYGFEREERYVRFWAPDRPETSRRQV
jgi:hypothetical protein